MSIHSILFLSYFIRPSPHKCMVEGCGRVFTYRSGLLAHIKGVHDQKFPIHCPEKNCNMQFGSNTQLQEHYERVHRNQQGQPPLFDSTRIQPTLHPMQLSVLPIDMNRGINPTNQTQQIIMPSVPIRSTALRSDTLIGDLSIMSDVITNTQKYDCLLRKKKATSRD